MKKILTIWTVGLILVAFSLLSFSCAGNDAADGNADQPASISGRLYLDEDQDNYCDECECGIGDITVTLHVGTCSGDLLMSTHSDEDGYFNFDNLEPGQYCVFPDVSFSCEGFTPTTARTQTITVAAGEDGEMEPFGFQVYYESLDE